MKTTLIQIDPHDDLTSIKDKMTWAKSSRMLLFFPNGYPMDQSPLTMKLIRRFAEANGARVALVTRNRIMREIAGEEGIPCFASAPQAEKKNWPKPKQSINQRTIQGAENIILKKNGVKNQPKKKSTLGIQRSITVLILLILLVLSFMIFIPSAKITFFPELIPQAISYKVIADPTINTVLTGGSIPLEKITTSISGEIAGDSTGRVSIPKTKATGEVSLINLTTKNVILPRGTIVSTGGTKPIEFYLTTDISLPGSSKEIHTAAIEAVTAGVEGNVTSNSIIHISGLDQSVSITNLASTSGGFAQSYPTPTAADYEKLENQLMEQLLVKCKNEINVKVSEGELLLEPSVGIDQITSKSQTPKIGEPSDRANLSLEMECTALVVEEKDEFAVAKLKLDQDLPLGLLPVNDQVKLERISPITRNSEENYTWTVNASRELMQSLQKDKILKMISGKPIEEVREILISAFKQTKEAELKITPRWWKRLPILPGKIEVEFWSE